MPGAWMRAASSNESPTDASQAANSSSPARSQIQAALFAAACRVAARVHDEVGDGKLVGQHVAAPPDECAQSRQQLAEVERLREIVVGAGVESFDLVVDGVARGEHEHGRVRALAPDLAADVDTVANGKDDVEDDGVVVVDGGEERGAVTVGRVVDGVGRLPKSARDGFAQLTVVFGEQYSHGSER